MSGGDSDTTMELGQDDLGSIAFQFAAEFGEQRGQGLSEDSDSNPGSMAATPDLRKRKLGFQPDEAAQAGAQQAAAVLQKGFATLEDLVNWPGELLQRIFGKDEPDAFLRRRRLEAALMHGLALHTDFSGKGSVELCLELLSVVGKERQ